MERERKHDESPEAAPGAGVRAEVPAEVREGVREGIREALSLELDRTSARTAGLLATAGVLGLAGAVGAVVLFAGHSFATGHAWHMAVCAAAWTGLLVECFAVVLLRIRVGRIPLTEACGLGLLGLALAGLLGFVCPEPHYLAWWDSTALGRAAGQEGGRAASALCLGACSALVIGVGASLILALRGVGFRSALLPALLLFLLLWPAVVLQSVDTSAAVFGLWSAGLLAGCYVGVALGLWPARRLRTAVGGGRAPGPSARPGGGS